jgi:hypothetical protein
LSNRQNTSGGGFFRTIFFSTENFQPIKKKKNSAKKNTVATTSAGSDRVKTGNEAKKKELPFFLAALFFGGKWSVERRLFSRLEQPSGTKEATEGRPLVCFPLVLFLFNWM